MGRTSFRLVAGILGAWVVAGAGPGRAEAPGPAGRSLHLPAALAHYADPDLPAHFRTRQVRRFDNTPPDNPMTDAGATLGLVLFYDTRLSANDTLSCGSCHQQKHAFSDPRRVSKGYDGREGDRHTARALHRSSSRYRPR